MSYVDHVIEKLGGVAETMRVLRKPQSTVSSWIARAEIPPRWQRKIMAESDRRGLGVEFGDFFMGYQSEFGVSGADERQTAIEFEALQE